MKSQEFHQSLLYELVVSKHLDLHPLLCQQKVKEAERWMGSIAADTGTSVHMVVRVPKAAHLCSTQFHLFVGSKD